MSKEDKLEIQIKEQNNLRNLEKFYVNGTVDDLIGDIEKSKDKLVNEMINYADKHLEPCKWDKDGDPINFQVRMNPLYINNHFFKSIIPINCQEPIYNAEKLGMVFDYYCDLIAEVNDKIGNFPSSLTSFCKFAGLTYATLRNYKNSSDINMRIVAEKIYDQIGDENLTMSQMGVVKERSTIFKLKAQNDMVEKVQPKVNINIVEQPNMERINERLNKYKQFANKKNK